MPNTSNSTNFDISASYQAVNTTYNALFEQLFQTQPTQVSSFYAKKISVDTKTLQMDMLGPSPVMAKWLGPRPESYLRAYKYSITLDAYVATLWLDRQDCMYDKSGAIGRKIGDYFKSIPNVYDKQAIAALIANGTGYDGVSLLSASHPHATGGGTWSNYDTNALNIINVRTAEQNALDITLENGEPAGVTFTHAIVGPKNKDTARRIWQATERVAAFDGQGKETDFAGNPATVANVYQGEYTVVVDQRLRGSTSQYFWYLVDATKPYGPVIIMEAMPPSPTTRKNDDDPEVWNNQRWGFGVVGDISFAVGAPQTISGHHATAGGY